MKQDKAYKERLAEWRQKHFKEMERNMQINIQIRDDPNEKAKDRIDASKTIARMLGTLAPEKIEKKEAPKKQESPFSAEEEARLDARLRETLGDSWIESKKSTSAN